MGAVSAPVAAPSGGRSIPEMTVLREWEEKHAQHLEELDRKEIADKEARRKDAQEKIAAFNAERKENITKKTRSNRAEAEALEKAKPEAAANPWERVAELIDTSARAGAEDGQDTSRMRALLIHLKTSPLVTAN